MAPKSPSKISPLPWPAPKLSGGVIVRFDTCVVFHHGSEESPDDIVHWTSSCCVEIPGLAACDAPSRVRGALGLAAVPWKGPKSAFASPPQKAVCGTASLGNVGGGGPWMVVDVRMRHAIQGDYAHEGVAAALRQDGAMIQEAMRKLGSFVDWEEESSWMEVGRASRDPQAFLDRCAERIGRHRVMAEAAQLAAAAPGPSADGSAPKLRL